MLGLTADGVRRELEALRRAYHAATGTSRSGSCTADVLIQIHGNGANRLPPTQLPQSWATLRELARESVSPGK